MKNRSTYGFSYRASMIMLAMSLLCMGKTALGQEGPIAPVADVFKVMELASGSKMDTLWPEFKVLEIPVSFLYSCRRVCPVRQRSGSMGLQRTASPGAGKFNSPHGRQLDGDQCPQSLLKKDGGKIRFKGYGRHHRP